MRTSEILRILAIVAVVGGVAASRPAVSNDKRAAPAVAAQALPESLERGLQAYRRGDHAAAIKALEGPAADRVFMAQFALAQIYADNSGSETDHAKAYMLYQSIADEYSDVDPDDMRRAPFVARALTTLAGYLLVGIPQIGVTTDPERAADYLHHAALFFGHEDAQFELVKLKLKGDGLPADVASAKHWLSVLTQRGHAGAQAFLADLLWRGKHMDKDQVRAMALIAVAAENAPPKERIWIEDVYQNIFCGAGEGVRKQATGIVAEWRTRYGRKPVIQQRFGLTPLDATADRTCQNGERVGPLQAASTSAGTSAVPPSAPETGVTAPVSSTPSSPGQTTGAIPGSVPAIPGIPNGEPKAAPGATMGLIPTPAPLSNAGPAPSVLPAPTPLASNSKDGIRDIGVTAR
jgi:TPR repeat protein